MILNALKVGPIHLRKRIEHSLGRHPEGEDDPLELLEHDLARHPEGGNDQPGLLEHNLDHNLDKHLEDIAEPQEHNIDHTLDKPLEGGAEPKQGIEFEKLGTFLLVSSVKKTSQGPEIRKYLK